ncbi:hypothetical protein AUJ66_07635 [Candidatus Desantisbacteria bacterium CG1_02_38_46]|uniref:Uncharacterized protein n=2 Tax=unclassified Candidatus Desantisiibacteriota TaxID=3106372 RepID=A0A1J4SD33_9BACT|nr:MAG: hypothetical protein AUJ66_07635 [Candidatus Desantisbacteria bacterium CG1_02_38_46]PIU50838.1 MAG: hypothetical protein COS91_07585 [Candidatus Desantisbacteria bacterium CG07_land_8_20_14_0_80_39_15]
MKNEKLLKKIGGIPTRYYPIFKGAKMDIDELDQHLLSWTKRLKQENQNLLNAALSSIKSAFPFNEYEHRIAFFLNRGVISFDEYKKLRDNYVGSNQYLELYGLAPRVFGDIWCKEHLIGIDQRFKEPSKKLDPKYDGEYDLWLNGIKIEVKAGRATKTKERGAVTSKAIPYKSEKPFWINMQQIKLDICDVFILIGVWTDRICYWVLSNDEVKNHSEISHQHRGGIEYQIGITERNVREFDKYLVEPTKLVDTILEKVK